GWRGARALPRPRGGPPARPPPDPARRRPEPRAEPVEGRGVGDLPAEEGGAVIVIRLDHHPLAAVVHAERKTGLGLLHQFEPDQTRRESRPVVEIAGTDAEIAEGLQFHGTAPFCEVTQHSAPAVKLVARMSGATCRTARLSRCALIRATYFLLSR